MPLFSQGSNSGPQIAFTYVCLALLVLPFFTWPLHSWRMVFNFMFAASAWLDSHLLPEKHQHAFVSAAWNSCPWRNLTPTFTSSLTFCKKNLEKGHDFPVESMYICRLLKTDNIYFASWKRFVYWEYWLKWFWLLSSYLTNKFKVEMPALEFN